MTDSRRRPAAFSLDDPDVTLSDDARRPSARVLVTPELQEIPSLPVPVPPSRRKRFPFATVFWSALGGLVTLALGLAVTSLIEELFTRAAWLGTVGAVLAGLAGVALLAIVV